jgi:hypothetical protein
VGVRWGLANRGLQGDGWVTSGLQRSTRDVIMGRHVDCSGESAYRPEAAI